MCHTVAFQSGQSVNKSVYSTICFLVRGLRVESGFVRIDKLKTLTLQSCVRSPIECDWSGEIKGATLVFMRVSVTG